MVGNELIDFKQQLREFLKRKKENLGLGEEMFSKRIGYSAKPIRQFIRGDEASQQMLNCVAKYFLDDHQGSFERDIDGIKEDYSDLMEYVLKSKLSLKEIEEKSKTFNNPRAFLKGFDKKEAQPEKWKNEIIESENERLVKDFFQLEKHSDNALGELGFIERVGVGKEAVRVHIDDVCVKRVVEKDLVEEIQNDQGSNLILVSGGAGYGKSTLLWSIYNHLKSTGTNECYFVKSSKLFDLSLFTTILNGNTTVRKGELVPSGSVFLIDTLDAILSDSVKHDQMITLLNHLTGADAKVIATTRPAESLLLRVTALQVETKKIELDKYDETELEEAILNYAQVYYKYSGYHEPADFVAEVNSTTSHSSSLKELCKNPLTLRMLFSIYSPKRIPVEINTHRLYSDFWERRVVSDRGPGRLANKENDNFSEFTGLLSICMLSMGQIEVSVSQIENWFEYTAMPFDFGQISSLKSRGVIRISDEESSYLISFFHQTFFEFSAAQLFNTKGLRGLKILKTRTLFNQGYTEVNNLFLLPIYEQFLLLKQKPYCDTVNYEVQYLLTRSSIASIRSGIYVYGQLAKSPEEETRRVIQLGLGKWDTVTVKWFLEVMANISQSRVEELYHDIHKTLISDSLGNWTHVISLLERFAEDSPSDVVKIYHDAGIIQRFFSLPKTTRHHNPATYKIISTIAKVSRAQKTWAQDSLLEVIKISDDRNAFERILLVAAYEKVFLEYNDIRNLLGAYPVKKNIVEILRLASKLWLVFWEETKENTESILERIIYEKDSFIRKTQLCALARKASALDRSEPVMLLDHWLFKRKEENFSDWTTYFIREFLEQGVETHESVFYRLLVKNISETIRLKNSEESIEVKACLDALDSNNICSRTFLEIFDFEDFQSEQFWLDKITQNSIGLMRLYQNLFVNLYYSGHQVVNETVRLFDSSSSLGQLKKLPKRLIKRFLYPQKDELINDLYWPIRLLLSTDGLGVRELRIHLQGYLEKQDKARRARRRYLKNEMPEKLQELYQLFVQLIDDNLKGSISQRCDAASLWGCLLCFDTYPKEDFHGYRNLLLHEEVPEVLIALLEIGSKLEDYLEILEDTFTRVEQLMFSSEKNLRLRARIEFLRSIKLLQDEQLRKLTVKYPPDKLMYLIFQDFNMDQDSEKVAVLSSVIERLSKIDTDYTMDFVDRFFSSQGILSHNSKKYKKDLFHAFKRAIISLFRQHVSSVDKFDLTRKVCESSDEFGRLFLFAFFSFPGVVSEFRESDFIWDVSKEVENLINNYQKRGIGQYVNSEWPELRQVLLDT